MELRDALKSNQFQLEAQPIVGLRARGEIVGFELLVRMRSAAGELVAPDKFLEACAQYGLMPALDRWVLCAAIEALRPHAQALASAPLFFTINVSAQSLQSRQYAAFALGDARQPPACRPACSVSSSRSPRPSPPRAAEPSSAISPTRAPKSRSTTSARA